MTIDRIYGQVVFTCDNCGEALDTERVDFGEALAVLKLEGWKSELVLGEWEHRCPDCRSDGGYQDRASADDF